MDKTVLASKYSAIEAALSFKPTALRECIASNNGIDAAFDKLSNNAAYSRVLNESYEKCYSLIVTWSLEPNTNILIKEKNEYPQQLASWANSTEVLYVKGHTEYLSAKCVAVVGSRAATDTGRVRAAYLSKLLCEKGYCVSSGLALGIDTAAHVGALRAAGQTLAVIGTPINKYYPKENVQLQNHIAEAGALVSQFSPIRPTQQLNFPQRNELMSAFSVATVIVEAGETSGALTQARYCLKQGKKLFIMQNQIDKKELTWPREYLKKGAIAIKNPEELFEKLDSSTEAAGTVTQLKFL